MKKQLTLAFDDDGFCRNFLKDIFTEKQPIKSPLRMLLVIIVTVLAFEVIIVAALDGVNLSAPYLILVEASVLIFMLASILYIQVYKPLIASVEKQSQLMEKHAISYNMLTMVLNSLDTLVFVVDIATREILMINKYGFDMFGDVIGKPCWSVFQAGQTGPCESCCNKKLLDGHGQPTGLRKWEGLSSSNQRWYVKQARAIRWIDGRMVRLEIATDLTVRKNVEEEREALIKILKRALDEVKALSGIVPICMYCKEIRDDKGYWNNLEKFISERSEAEFSHSICPDCLKENFAEEANQIL